MEALSQRSVKGVIVGESKESGGKEVMRGHYCWSNKRVSQFCFSLGITWVYYWIQKDLEDYSFVSLFTSNVDRRNDPWRLPIQSWSILSPKIGPSLSNLRQEVKIESSKVLSKPRALEDTGDHLTSPWSILQFEENTRRSQFDCSLSELKPEVSQDSQNMDQSVLQWHLRFIPM